MPHRSSSKLHVVHCHAIPQGYGKDLSSQDNNIPATPLPKHFFKSSRNLSSSLMTRLETRRKRSVWDIGDPKAFYSIYY